MKSLLKRYSEEDTSALKDEKFPAKQGNECETGMSTSEFDLYNNKVEHLGHGGFGKVYKVVNSANGNVYAMKIIDIRQITYKYIHETPIKNRPNPVSIPNTPLRHSEEHILYSLLTEVRIMRELNHPNIVPLYNYYLNNVYDRMDAESNISNRFIQNLGPKQLHLIIEYSEHGSLLSYIRSQHRQRLPEVLCAGVSNQILDGLEYLASKNVVHGDIKAANILIFPHGVVKLCDFGLSFQWDDDELYESYDKGKANNSKRLQKIATNGSAYWLAPEIIIHRMATPKSDIWSLGATVIEMLSGRPPFSNRGPLSACHAVGSGCKIEYPEWISSECKKFLDLCFQYDPARRARARTLNKHPWIKHSKRNILEFVELAEDEINEEEIEEIKIKERKNKEHFMGGKDDKHRKLLETFKEGNEDFLFNDQDFEICDTSLQEKLKNMSKLSIGELQNIPNIVDNASHIFMNENYVSNVIASIKESSSICKTEEILRIGQNYLLNHPEMLERLCLSGSLPKLIHANNETLSNLRALVLHNFSTRGREWLLASGLLDNNK